MCLFHLSTSFSRTYSAIIGCFCKLLRGQIDNKFSALTYDTNIAPDGRKYKPLPDWCKSCPSMRSSEYYCSFRTCPPYHHHCRSGYTIFPAFHTCFPIFAPSTAAVPKPVSVQAVSFWTPHPLARSSPDFLSDQTQRSSFLLLRFRRIKVLKILRQYWSA